MKLSEDRINHIAHKIAFDLKKKRLVNPFKSVSQIEAWVEKPMLEDFAIEDQIDEEVRRLLAGMDNCPPEGSYDYQAIYIKKKEEVAARHNYQF